MYVGSKNRDTGMLYDVTIYDISSGFQNMVVIVGDSAQMTTSEDKLSIVFTVYNGQQFHNFTQGNQDRRSSSSSSEFVPYARENFSKKTMTIPYDDNFNRMEESVLQENTSSNYVSKNIAELKSSIDSLEHYIDSINVTDRKVMKEYTYLSFRNSYPKDSRDSLIAAAKHSDAVDIDSLLQAKDYQGQNAILRSAFTKADNNNNDYMFRSMNKTATQRNINRQWIEWHRKFTLSFACLVFFFIGAPLGSIVRKGGLGMPIVISVILFIIYYILDNVGYKMARDGVWMHWVGMWFSSMILLPLGVFLTYKAMNDSVIMSTDIYVGFFKQLFFIREKRNYTIKDVVIEDVIYEDIYQSTLALDRDIELHLQKYSHLRYVEYWKDTKYDISLNKIKIDLENILNKLSNSRKSGLIDQANEYPILIKYVRPFKAGSTPDKVLMYLFPVGIVIKILSIPFERRINQDLKMIVKLNAELNDTMQFLAKQKAESNS